MYIYRYQPSPKSPPYCTRKYGIIPWLRTWNHLKNHRRPPVKSPAPPPKISGAPPKKSPAPLPKIPLWRSQRRPGLPGTSKCWHGQFFVNFDVILAHVLAFKPHISIQNMIWDHPHGGKTHEEPFFNTLRPPKHRFRWVFHGFMMIFDIFRKISSGFFVERKSFVNNFLP